MGFRPRLLSTTLSYSHFVPMGLNWETVVLA
jgi:hypothetical protein